MASSPVIVINYGGRDGSFDIGVKPSLELRDDDIDQAADNLWDSIRRLFQFNNETRFAVHEAESNRILTKETFRDPSCIPFFPKYWYITVDNGYHHHTTSTTATSHSASDLAFLSSTGDETNVSCFTCNVIPVNGIMFKVMYILVSIFEFNGNLYNNNVYVPKSLLLNYV